jgi:hypothetical protein
MPMTLAPVQQSPQQEALELLTQVLRDLQAPERDLKQILRRCHLACVLAGWTDQAAWFVRELDGYPAGSALPAYRRVSGVLDWRVKGAAMFEFMRSYEQVHGRQPPDETEATVLDVYAGIDWLVGAARNGCGGVTGETKNGWLHLEKKPVELERFKRFEPTAFQTSLTTIENLIFTWVSQTYKILRYGSALTDVWTDYRTVVESALQRLGLTAHLDAIQAGVRSTNPEEGRSAVYACRSLLHDLAAHLWRDPRKHYEHIKAGTPPKPIEVTADKIANRLSAYAHQKGLTGRQGSFARAENERLYTSIRSLVELQGGAHGPVRREEARAIALDTYRIIAELALKTDLEPVLEYGTPVITDQE